MDSKHQYDAMDFVPPLL